MNFPKVYITYKFTQIDDLYFGEIEFSESSDAPEKMTYGGYLVLQD